MKRITIELDLPAGQVERECQDPKRFTCPICGSDMKLKRSKISDFIEDKHKQPVNVFKRAYQCPSCGYKLYTQVWRPYGENSCCQERLGRLTHPSTTHTKRAWVERLDSTTLIYKRVESMTCICGTYYEWPEMGTAPYRQS